MKILITSICLVSSLFSDVKVGETLPLLTLKNQFDKKVELQEKGKSMLLFSFEKEVSSEIKEFLERKEKNFLEENNASFIFDISKLPSLMVSMFALPKMKTFPFEIALIYDEEEASKLNFSEGKLTVVELNDNNVTSVKFVAVKDLDEVFK